ncbi:MAG: SDR family oxidoreductase [Luteimonas sp.]|nr:SDR family oxidoreductase [Luteimonas sp.]
MAQQHKQWALVTGASSGLGLELARALAARNFNVVLVARRGQLLLNLSAQLERQHGIATTVEAVDLAAPNSSIALQRRLVDRGVEPTVLVNNAAFGIGGRFVNQDTAQLRAMVQVNIVALMELAHVFGERMASYGRGHMLFVASTAANGPTPMLAAYGASKAFVLSLGEALRAELAPKVGVTVLMPGLMDTGFAGVSGYRAPDWARSTMLAPASVAKIGLDAMFAGKSSIVAGHLNRLLVSAGRFTPRELQARMLFRSAVKSVE